MRRMFHGSGKIEFPGLMLKKISTLETLYLQIGRNRIFSSPKCGKFAHTTRRKIAFSGLQKKREISTPFARHLVTLLSRIVRNRIFRLPKCGKFAHTKLGTFETFRLTTRQKSHFLATKKQKIGKRMLDVPETVGFRTRQKSHFQAPEMKKICSTVSINRVDSFHQSKIAFSGIKNVENFHTHCVEP